MAHPHEELLRGEIEGLLDGSPLEDFYTDDAVLHYPGTSPVAGEYHGKAGFDEFFGRIEGIVSSIERQLHDAVANDDHGVQILTVRARRHDGREHEWRAVWVCHFRDGKISELWGHMGDQQALDEFLSG